MLFAVAVAAYALSSALFVAYLTGARAPRTAAHGSLALAAAFHTADAARLWLGAHEAPLSNVGPALSTLGLLIAASLLLAQRARPRLDVLAAFAAPVALLLLVASRAVGGRAAEVVSPLLVLHIGASVVGVAAFTVACAMAVAYLLQERQVKARHLGTLFHRLPPLEMLDTLGFRCIVFGLAALTVGLVTGHVVSTHLSRGRGLPWQQYFAMTSWVLFAAVLVLRWFAGWRGRRAAIGTILGYSSAALSLLLYATRAAAS